jgi:N-acetylneuraminate synthase/N,N'-diacetyllegionaminate synthase
VNSLQIAHKTVGRGHPCFIIAEAGVNHNGDIELAQELVRQARATGVDCVKFQTFKAERVVTAAAPKAAYQLRVTDPAESQFAMLRKLELSESDHRTLLAQCNREGIVFLSTPYSIEDAELLHALDVPGFKIASGQLVELPFLAAIARFNRPTILSTGMATMDEIAEAAKTLRDHGNDQFAVLQCTTNYPSRLADTNLRAMSAIHAATSAITGYSDHTEGISACIASVALGASIVEKHFTLDRNLPGPDHRCSSEPAEMRALVQGIREVELALGDGVKRPTAAELANLTGMRRSVVAARLIRAGERVAAQDFAFKRPATGLAPKRLDEIVGRTARIDIASDQQVQPGDFA